jgi:hypothetical protein
LEITAVAVGHFNGDNNIDIVVSLFEWDRIGGYFQVRLGDGQGGFTGSDNDPYQPSLYPADEAIAVDLNNDGKLDVVTAGQVLLGNGDSTLQNESYYAAGVGGPAVATGDFTGDGNADVIVAGTGVAVLRGKGDGGFLAPLQNSASGPNHTAVATADFNSDGKLDAVVTDGDSGTVSLMLGNGDGTLDYAGAFATGASPSGIAVGDFNRDGRPDMAVANILSHTVSVLLNDGVWQAEPNLIGDYNRNGTVDAADYVVWRKMQGTTVTPSTGADGNGDGMVDQDDYGEWREHFGQTLPAPGAGSGKSAGAEMNSPSVQVSDAKQAVEVRGASEHQRAMMARDSALIELLTRPTTGLAEIRRVGPPSLGISACIEANRRGDARVMGIAQPDSRHAATEWDSGNKFGSILEDLRGRLQPDGSEATQTYFNFKSKLADVPPRAAGSIKQPSSLAVL